MTHTSLGNAEERLARLRRVVLNAVDGAACERCLAGLDAYVTAQLAQADYLAEFATTAEHLDACPPCAAAYARLYELALADAAEQLPQPAAAAAPDLSFLPDRPSLTQRLRAAVQRTGDQLTLRLTAELAALLRPSPPPALALRAADRARYAERLLQLDAAQFPELALPVSLSAYRDGQQPNLCLVEALVEPPGASWPDLGGTAVTLTIAGQSYQATTDAWGLAAFPDVPIAALPELTIRVEGI